MNEWHALCEASDEPCSVVSQCLMMTEGSPQNGSLVGGLYHLPMPRDTQRPCEGSGWKWAKHVDWTFLSWSAFPGLFDCFIIAWGIRTTNLICWIIDFQRTCDPCCYYVVLLRPHVWKGLALLGVHLGAIQNSDFRNVSQVRGHSLGCLPQGPETWKWVFAMAVPPIYVGRSIAGHHEVFEDKDWEFQDLVRLEMKWVSSFGSTSS